ncbi:MAG: DUF433 domain-containing protein [Ekhidna sp.]|nr:DUF433 domain-containing protein [Ekhidna sp.]
MTTLTTNYEKPKIGEGVYAVSDIAKILRLPYSKVKYTMETYLKGKFSADIDYKYAFEMDDKFYAVNFYALIEISVFYLLQDKNVKSKKIMEAHTTLAKVYDTPYPFIKKAVYTDGGQIFFGDDSPMIVADKSLQLAFHQFLEPYCAKIKFDKSDLATKYYPIGKDKHVVVKPENQFGQPVIEGTNIIPEVIYDLYSGGDSINLIASLYDLSIEQISDAIEYAKAA